MDELLALMDNDVPTGEIEISSGVATEGEESQAQESIVAAPSPASTRPPTHPDLNRSRARTTPAVTTLEPTDRIEIGIDNKLGIRMLKRQMSSIDLMDLISSNPYHSPASIAAMSLASLNRLLAEPTSVLSAATICGKTNICTVGIVFSNSGTRISSNGRAFSILNIGNLQTGPVASVFMFGEAYSKLCTKCPPGTVVALVSPSLMSPKEQSQRRDNTAVSFSVANPRQLLPVAQARDYGVCKGTVSTKRSDGKWISNGGQCKQHVDIRVSQYCEKHRAQRNVKNNGASVKGNGQMTFIQQQKAELRPSKYNGSIMTMQMPGGRTVVTAHHNKPGPLSIMDELETFKSTTGRFPNAAPMQMKKKQPNTTLQKSRIGTSNRQLQGCMRTTTNTLTTRTNSAIGCVPVQGDWLNPMNNRSLSAKKTPLTGKKRTIYRDSGEYDGSVAIPKPNKLFRGRTPVPQQRRVTPNQGTLTESKVDSIREQQRLFAQRQKENSSHRQGHSRNLAPVLVTKGRLSAEDALKGSLFGKFSSVDTQEMVNAKSRFEDEAKAEEYAKSRRVVSELERQEELKMKSNKHQPDMTSVHAIQKEYLCVTCKKTTKFFPKLCKRANHKISQKRSIKKADTVQERRLKLDEQSAEDGGLKLGTGLEWDRRRFS